MITEAGSLYFKEWKKQCPNCGRTYFHTSVENMAYSFYRDKKTDDGLTVWCKKCVDIRTERTRENARRKKKGLEPLTTRPWYAPEMDR